MRTIILEGASTSGKTTVANLLVEALTGMGKTVHFVDENQTLMPILKYSDRNSHFNHLKKLLSKIQFSAYEFVIFDRLQLTSAAVTNNPIENFEQIESELLKYDPLIIFLKVEEDKLGDRIFKAMEHREASWKEHVLSKGGKEDIIGWYLQTQRNLLTKLKESKIPYQIIDATNSDYEAITQKVLDLLDK